MGTKTTYLLFIDSLESGSQDIAHKVLRAMNTPESEIQAAVGHEARTEKRAFRIPKKIDYYGLESGQGLPAWVRVINISHSDGAQKAAAQFRERPEVQSALRFGAYTHIAHITSELDNSDELIQQVVADFPPRWRTAGFQWQ